jgi:neutral trehalase
MAMAGLQRYGFEEDAKRLARKWTSMIAEIHHRGHVMVERMDVVARDVPGADGSKYPTQAGFLWTNGSFVWSLVDVLGYRVRAGQ